MNIEKCKECMYSRIISAQHDFKFLGCEYGDYKGKWVAEIDVCPLGDKIERKFRPFGVGEQKTK
jgi:hypothetical protein